LAAEGCVSRETYTHIKEMRSALDEIKRRKRPSAQRARATTQPPKAADVAISTIENAAGIQPTSAVASENIVAATVVLPALPSGTYGPPLLTKLAKNPT